MTRKAKASFDCIVPRHAGHDIQFQVRGSGKLAPSRPSYTGLNEKQSSSSPSKVVSIPATSLGSGAGGPGGSQLEIKVLHRPDPPSARRPIRTSTRLASSFSARSTAGVRPMPAETSPPDRLVEPRSANTGAIARLCAPPAPSAYGEPLGFSSTDRALKTGRHGNYWQHATWAEADPNGPPCAKARRSPFYFITTKASKTYTEARYAPGDSSSSGANQGAARITPQENKDNASPIPSSIHR